MATNWGRNESQFGWEDKFNSGGINCVLGKITFYDKFNKEEINQIQINSD